MNAAGKTLLCLLILLTQSLFSRGDEFSYVWIQGDKKTPIYTKVEGVMMPRYGKNYALLAPLAPGPMNLEILFQQNEHPPLHFQILVPENGKRAFLLSKKEGKFALYDIQQNFYLPDDNKLEDDHLPTILTNQSLISEARETAKSPNPHKNPASPVVRTKPAVEPESPKTDATDTRAQKPEFIEGITFDNERKAGERPLAASQTATEKSAAAPVAPVAAIPNSDCKTTISNEKYFRLRGEMRLMTGEDQRLGALEEATKQYCFNTKQASELVHLLNSDIARLSALKSLYPKISDQSNYGDLASLITDADTRNYFLDFLNKK